MLLWQSQDVSMSWSRKCAIWRTRSFKCLLRGTSWFRSVLNWGPNSTDKWEWWVSWCNKIGLLKSRLSIGQLTVLHQNYKQQSSSRLTKTSYLVAATTKEFSIKESLSHKSHRYRKKELTRLSQQISTERIKYNTMERSLQRSLVNSKAGSDRANTTQRRIPLRVGRYHFSKPQRSHRLENRDLDPSLTRAMLSSRGLKICEPISKSKADLCRAFTRKQNLKTKLTNVKASARLWVNYRQPTECSKTRTGSFKMHKLCQEKNLLKRRGVEWGTTLPICKTSLMKTMILLSTTERSNLISNHLITCAEVTTTWKDSHSQDLHQPVRLGRSRDKSHKCETTDSLALRLGH